MIVKRFAKIFLGCLGITVILVILGAIFAGRIVKNLITQSIQQKTGVNVNIDNIKNGQLTYTDPKTGQTLNIGGNKIPDNFPKDFPIYPGSNVTTSLTGKENSIATDNKQNYWLTLTTTDTPEMVVTYYKENLKNYGWITQESSGAGVGTSWAVNKNSLSGYVSVTTVNNQTSIIVVLGEPSPEPTSN